jgi:hypothetical protein
LEFKKSCVAERTNRPTTAPTMIKTNQAKQRMRGTP